MPDNDAIEVEGKVVAVLPGTMFKVELLKSPGHVVLAHISGKLRKNFIKIAAGDTVKMEMSPYDLEKARITFRMKEQSAPPPPSAALLTAPAPPLLRRAGRPPCRLSQRLSAFADIDAYLAFLDLERGLSRNTREGYQRDLDQCAAFVARRARPTGGGVTAEQAGAWVRSLGRRRLAAASQARKLTALRMFARFLVREDLRRRRLHGAPCPGPGSARRLPDTLSPDEIGRLLASPTGGDPAALRDRALLEFFYSSGLRVSELAALTLQQVDLENGFARVFGKGSKERVVPMGAGRATPSGPDLTSGRPHFVKAAHAAASSS